MPDFYSVTQVKKGSPLSLFYVGVKGLILNKEDSEIPNGDVGGKVSEVLGGRYKLL